ncbi:NUDIX hydrolase [Nitrosovibrio sp. Nv4]|uniref:NUDIX hydrolase n=1 Tax=Nitrosovibrio sp. Nv4 TaxID=1945880 RepID=UPI000BC88CE7|nr:NUDIX hydrolase [Nitrosovibrio sp. Nv4]SOD42633.1 ADP-ribose pyrophosphatase YjhB, NUDIX family [Nitrosovibrio sp. Nv4]
MIWKPNVTVAAVVEKGGQYLLVEEQTSSGILFNQPAGHLEPGESIISAAIRETLEETGYTFVPQSVLGIYHWHSLAENVTFIRFAFTGSVVDHDPDRALDTGIVRAGWFGVEEIRQMTYCHRSPLVMRCIEDHLAGKHYSLEILTHYD